MKRFLFVLMSLVALMAFSCASEPAEEAVEESSAMVFQAEDAVYEGDIVLNGVPDGDEEIAPADGDCLYMMGSGSIVFTFDVPEAGDYLCKMYYAVPESYGDKNQHVLVNGEALGEMTFAQSGGEWTSKILGVLALNAGTNEIEISHSWGYTWFDYLTVEPF